jgi:lactate dehydrogenase-like 2-hydroxyacid dehydrogenase
MPVAGEQISRLEVLLPFAISICTDELLSELFLVHRLYQAANPAQFMRAIGPRIRVVAISAGSGFPAHLWASLPALELVVIHGVGTDKIDLEEAARRNVRVLTSPHVMAEDTADLAIGMWIALCRRMVDGHDFVRNGQWRPGSPFPLARTVTGQRVGIVGLGRIGNAIARRAAPFASVIAYTGRNPRPDSPYDYVPTVQELAARSDVLFLATPGGANTRGLVNGEVLAALGPAGFLVNVARGSVVDETALLSALRENRLAGAALDVFDNEPHINPQFFSLPNLILQPHVGSSTVETRQKMAQIMAEQISQHFKVL